MDETPSPQTPEQGLNKLDLSQLQGFSFGTSWTQDKASPGGGGGGRSDRRDDRSRREGGDGPVRRDRRDFRRPASSPASGGEGDASGSPDTRGGASRFERRDDRGGPRGERSRGEFRGPRREGGHPGGARGEFRGQPREAGPYVSPHFTVTFYPEDSSFKILADAIRKSCRTFELFYIAKSVVEKNDRFVAVVQRIAPGAKPGSSATGEEGAAPATPSVKPAPFFISVPDGIPFETEDAAIAHVLDNHLGLFFETSEVEVDPPKGNFQVVNRCTITGTLLGPPNYHRYNQIVAQHHAAHIRMPLEAYKAKIETVRDPEVVAQWLEKMKKATRYTWKPAPAKGAAAAAKAAAESPASAESPAPTAPAAEGEAPAVAAEETAPAPAPEAVPAGPSFDTLEEARQHLLTTARERVVRTVEQLRFPGRILENIPPTSEIRRAVEGALAAQRRFPLDTANALRGRLRREHFTIFKKGSKGISYVCAVKRRFRVPGQVFSESLSALISFIEANPMVRESELPQRMLNLAPRPAPAEGQPPEPVPPEEQEKITRLKGDLRYLVKEGYVTEFVDGSLFCPPPMVEARKREIESAEIDPENFPEAPQPAPATTEPEAGAADPAGQSEQAEAPAAETQPESEPESSTENRPETGNPPAAS